MPHVNTCEAAEAVAQGALGHVRGGKIASQLTKRSACARTAQSGRDGYGMGLSTASMLERMTLCTVPLLHLARKPFFPCTS